MWVGEWVCVGSGRAVGLADWLAGEARCVCDAGWWGWSGTECVTGSMSGWIGLGWVECAMGDTV